MKHWKAITAALLVPLALAACLFLPGKFVVDTDDPRRSQLHLHAYKGEVVALDIAGAMSEATSSAAIADNGTRHEGAAPDRPRTRPAEKAAEKGEEGSRTAISRKALAKEAGYRSVEYRGDGIVLCRLRDHGDARPTTSSSPIISMPG
jgi:hypothetical protein